MNIKATPTTKMMYKALLHQTQDLEDFPITNLKATDDLRKMASNSFSLLKRFEKKVRELKNSNEIFETEYYGSVPLEALKHAKYPKTKPNLSEKLIEEEEATETKKEILRLMERIMIGNNLDRLLSRLDNQDKKQIRSLMRRRIGDLKNSIKNEEEEIIVEKEKLKDLAGYENEVLGYRKEKLSPVSQSHSKVSNINKAIFNHRSDVINLDEHDQHEARFFHHKPEVFDENNKNIDDYSQQKENILLETLNKENIEAAEEIEKKKSDLELAALTEAENKNSNYDFKEVIKLVVDVDVHIKDLNNEIPLPIENSTNEKIAPNNPEELILESERKSTQTLEKVNGLKQQIPENINFDSKKTLPKIQTTKTLVDLEEEKKIKENEIQELEFELDDLELYEKELMVKINSWHKKHEATKLHNLNESIRRSNAEKKIEKLIKASQKFSEEAEDANLRIEFISEQLDKVFKVNEVIKDKNEDLESYLEDNKSLKIDIEQIQKEIRLLKVKLDQPANSEIMDNVKTSQSNRIHSEGENPAEESTPRYNKMLKKMGLDHKILNFRKEKNALDGKNVEKMIKRTGVLAKEFVSGHFNKKKE